MILKFTVLIKFLNRYWPITVIFVAALAIAVTNYQKGTILSGWDSLHPEFGFGFNISRSFHAVWQEYQGLGLLGGMGHAADLPRQIFLWIISIIIPNELNRYFFHFLMLMVGPFGIYILMHDFILKGEGNSKKFISLSSALFYLFNLATVQMFNVPFEPYSVHYALLPWLFYANLTFYTIPNKKNLFLLIFINILAIPQGYIGTFFLVYLIALSLLFFQLLIKHGKIKRIIIALLVLIIVNAFWLFPNLYFIKTKININVDSKINEMSTEDMFLRNKKFGDLSSIFLLKGFWFDNTEINVSGVNEYQLQDWIDYLDKPIIIYLGYSFTVLALIGALFALLKMLVVVN